MLKYFYGTIAVRSIDHSHLFVLHSTPSVLYPCTFALACYSIAINRTSEWNPARYCCIGSVTTQAGAHDIIHFRFASSFRPLSPPPKTIIADGKNAPCTFSEICFCSSFRLSRRTLQNLRIPFESTNVERGQPKPPSETPQPVGADRG